ncbi:MAG: hypothetical protein ACRDJO_11880, partial [Actinomycetota bacterium]
MERLVDTSGAGTPPDQLPTAEPPHPDRGVGRGRPSASRLADPRTLVVCLAVVAAVWAVVQSATVFPH